MVQPNLINIILKVRKYVAAPTPQQLSDSDIIDAINTYYLWNLPANLKLLSLEKRVAFYTQSNVDVYAFDTDAYYDVQPAMYVAGYRTQYLQDPAEFFRVWPKLKYKQQFETGDTSVGPFNGTLTGVPFLRSFSGNSETEILISCLDVNNENMVLVDNPTSITTGDLIIPGDTSVSYGTINYITGAVSNLIFPNGTLSGAPVEAQTTPYVAARPQTCLFFQNQFTLRPVPSDSFEVVYTAIVKPTEFLSTNPTAEPEIQEWWELLAVGAARIILQERLDENQLAVLERIYDEKLRNVERRTLTQLGNQRGPTIFSSPPNYPFDIYNPGSGNI